MYPCINKLPVNKRPWVTSNKSVPKPVSLIQVQFWYPRDRETVAKKEPGFSFRYKRNYPNCNGCPKKLFFVCKFMYVSIDIYGLVSNTFHKHT